MQTMEQIAAETGLELATVASIADYTETRARELVAQGLPIDAAATLAADESMAIARLSGLFA